MTLVAALSCTAGEPPREPRTASPRGVAGLAEPANGFLRVDAVLGCCYTEGGFLFVRLATEDGDVVLEESVRYVSRRRIVAHSLPPGTYSLETYDRACLAACPRPFRVGALDPPTNRCGATIVVHPAGRTTVVVDKTPGSGCRITVA